MVTAAAAVMVGVFSVFGTLSILEMKQMGVGLAAAVLLDATVVRGVLLPSVLALLGDRAHTGPRWLPRSSWASWPRASGARSRWPGCGSARS